MAISPLTLSLFASSWMLICSPWHAAGMVQTAKPAPPPPPQRAAPHAAAPAPRQAMPAPPARPAAAPTLPPVPPGGGLRQVPRTMVQAPGNGAPAGAVPARSMVMPHTTSAATGAAPVQQVGARQTSPGTPAALNNGMRGTSPNERGGSSMGAGAHGSVVSAPMARPVPPAEAQQKLADWDQHRSTLSGINSRPLPRGAQLQQLSSGHYVLNTADGRNYALDGDGRIHAFSHGQTRAAVDDRGQLQAVRTPNMLVKRTVAGERRVESRGADGNYVVSYGPGRGFVERPVSVGGGTLVERTTVMNGSVTVEHYQDFSYQGVVLQSYVPDTVYAPAYYAWLLAPWRAMVVSRPAAAVPIAPIYQAYYQPEPTYGSPAMWMTDQVIASNLGAANGESGKASGDEPAPQSTFEDLPRVSAAATTPVDHEMKLAVSQQLGQMLTRDAVAAQRGNSMAGTAMPAAIDPAIHFFFVDDGIDVRTARGESHCALSQGDALHLETAMAAGAREADLLVQTSLKGDCPSGTHVLVNIADLQAMNNHCHESLSAAAGRLASEGQQEGLPTPPPSGAHPLVPALEPVDLASRAKETNASIAQQQAESVRLEAATQDDLQASLR